MVEVQVKENHGCPKPFIPQITVETKVERKTWYGKRYVATLTETQSAYREARWTCECGAQWEWSAYEDNGFWLCRSRPDNWKKVNL